MIQRNYTFLTGILAGLGIAIAVASVFSLTAAQTWEQTSNNDKNSQAGGQNPTNSHMMQGGSNSDISLFSGEGVSMVNNVKVTGVSITGDKEVSVSLKYSGNGTAPGVTLVAMTQSMQDMMMPMSMMGSDNDTENMMSDGMMQGHEDMAAVGEKGSFDSMSQQMGQIHSGSNILNSGWNSPSTITVKIQGNTTANDDHVMVMVFPYLK